MSKLAFEDDQFWGSVLIALGIISIAFKPFEKIDRSLHGKSDLFLTITLTLLGVGAILLALNARPSLKALAILWIVTP